MQWSFILYVIGLLAIGYIIYQRFQKPGTPILVEYSELIGQNIIEHPNVYKGILLKNEDFLLIGKLGLRRPKPPHNVLRATTGSIKKVGLIKIDEDRYAYRIPSIDNEVFVYKRDENGHVIKSPKGKPKIVKKAWQFCDDVKEPNVKHWERLRAKEIREKHKTRDKLMTYLPAIAFAMIFVFAIIALHLTTKSFIADKEAIMQRAESAENRADETIDALNRFIDKNTGRQTVPEENQGEG